MPSLLDAIKLRTESTRQFVYRIISHQIRNMILLPDKKLSEAETSSQLKVSRAPVHDTFAQLSREKMLVVEPRRGTFVSRLDLGRVEQIVWMNRTLTIGVLENLYIARLPEDKLSKLLNLVEMEAKILKKGDFERAAQLNTEFYLELYSLAELVPVYRTLWGSNVDLYRLARMEDNAGYWEFVFAQHLSIAQSLLNRDHDQACAAVTHQYAAVFPLLEEMQRKNPHYFNT